MKKIVIVSTFLLASALSFAQGIFDKFEDYDDVVSVIINQRMFKMLATIDIDVDDPEAKELMDMATKITGLKVFTTGDEKISAEMKATVNKYLKSSQLDELMRVKDGDQTVKFYIKEGKDEDHVNELLMFVSGLKDMIKTDVEINGKNREFETVIVSLTGNNFDLRSVSKITNSFDIPAGDALKKVGDKKK